MSRTQGYHVKLTPQGSSHAEERGENEPAYIMDGHKPQLFMTEAQAIEAGQDYTRDKPDLTYLLEPVVP